ncbi:MAG: hypothetical protein PHN57_07370 [Candidatus Omnitrophica bacterium]|nr:hypothetical protein [Candidatus Omnitrophota bacterium]
MAEQIKDLIDKIQREGIKAAEDKAKEIEKEAVQKAAQIIEKATVDAHKIVAAAGEEAAKAEESTKVVLAQAARDMLLELKKGIFQILKDLIVSDIRKALTPEELARVITELIKDSPCAEKTEIIISLKKEDFEKLEKGFVEKLKEQLKRGITLRPSEDLSGGFNISYDAGKSHYDFSDKALAEYISGHLKPELSRIIKDSTR